MKLKDTKGNEFISDETKIMKIWLEDNSIQFDKNLIKNEHYLEYRESIIDEKDKLLFDKEIKKELLCISKNTR